MIYSILILALSVFSPTSASSFSDTTAPGTLRLVQTAQSLKDSSDAPSRQINIAHAWIATTTADVGGVPPQGPPDSLTATPRLMADWAISTIIAASQLGLGESAVAFAESQIACISTLLKDVDRTGTEPPNPYALAQVQLCAAELAWVRGDTETAAKMALASGETLSWRKDVFVTDSIRLSRLLAKLGRCELLERMAKNAPTQELPSLIASAASHQSCQPIALELITDPSLKIPGRLENLLYELKKVHGGATTQELIQQFPDILNTPQNRLAVTEILLTDGRIERGLEILGGEKILPRLKGYDSTDIHLALCLGYAKNGQLDKARAMINSIKGLDARFTALVEIDSRKLLNNTLTAPDVLKEFTTLRFLRPTAMDIFLPLIAKRPLPIDVVMSALMSSNRFELAATVLQPLFAPENQTGDEWLEKRIGIIANSLAISDPNNNEAWSELVRVISRCSHIDSQVKALCSIASAWNRSRPSDDLPDLIKETLDQSVMRIATKDHRPYPAK